MAVLRNFKASTLLETLVAMVIIMLCFSIGTMVYVNVITSENMVQKVHANIVLQNLALKIKNENEFLDSEMEMDDFFIKRKINNYQFSDNLIHLSLLAYQKNGKLVASHNEIILVNK